MAFITQGQKLQYNDLQTNADEQHAEVQALVFGVTQTSQSTLLLKKRKEMREVDEALDFMKEEFNSRMEACKERQTAFEIKQHEMKEQVSRFEKFVQENDAKRIRAENKMKLEIKARIQHEEKIKSLHQEYDLMQKVQKRIDLDLDHLERYQRYLDKVTFNSEGEYDEISDILNRLTTLQGANIDLKNLVNDGEREMDKIRGELSRLRVATQNEVLINNSRIHAQQKRLESIRATAIKSDSFREQSEKFAKDRHRESGQVIMSIKNLYNRCTSTAHSKSKLLVSKNSNQIDQLKEMLRVIRFRINDLQTVSNGYVVEEFNADLFQTDNH